MIQPTHAGFPDASKPANPWNAFVIPRLQAAWARYGTRLLWLANATLAAAAAGRLSKGFYRLLADPSRTGAIDLKVFHSLAVYWFSGRPVYGEFSGALYPPASYALLWPLYGPLEIGPARWFWGLTLIGVIAALTALLIRESQAGRLPERFFIALLPLAVSGSSVAIGNGQLIFHLLLPLAAGLLLLARSRAWATDLLGAGLFVIALVKPSITIPFFWILLFCLGRFRPALLVCLAYAALTLFAGTFQGGDQTVLFQAWLTNAMTALREPGYSNLHHWLLELGFQRYLLFVASGVLVGLGVWIYHHRHDDLWILIGVSALVARLWMYHFVYDDVLIVLPLLALFRLTKTERVNAGRCVGVGLTLALGTAAALAPSRLINLPTPWPVLYEAGQTIVWLAMLIFLLVSARKEPTLVKEPLPA